MTPQPAPPIAHPPAIAFHIGRLILHGVALHGPDAAAFRAGLESELQRLLLEYAAVAADTQPAVLRSLPAASFEFTEGTPPFIGGQRAAAVLHRVLFPNTPSSIDVRDKTLQAVSMACHRGARDRLARTNPPARDHSTPAT